jgi:hypothetical protein
MKKVWQRHFKRHKLYHSKRKRLALHLAISDAHQSGLPITARETHTQDNKLKGDDEYNDNSDDGNIVGEASSEDNDNNSGVANDA